ncbi:MAG: Trm112 family protein [Acidobacteriota bacterium]|nr:Trm112 family protein [Acidobacteriota bacterium]
MPPKPALQLKFDETVLSMLACPACQGDLRMDKTYLICAGCSRAYPIVDRIPTLIVEQAQLRE